jgi:hypothetical protein
MTDRADHYVPDGLCLESRPHHVEIAPPRNGQPVLARETIGLPDEYNRDIHWRWADVSGDGSHWSRFDGHHVQIDIAFRTENRREVNDWKGCDEIRAEGTWTLALNRQQIWEGFLRYDPLDQLLEIRRVAQRLLEHEALDWGDSKPIAEQLLGRRVYYRDTPAVVTTVSCLSQGCVILKPVGVAEFPLAVYLADRDEDDDERDEAKVDLLYPRVWWWRDKPAGDEEDLRPKREPEAKAKTAPAADAPERHAQEPRNPTSKEQA